MVAKKKRLYLGLLLSLFGIGNMAQAYTVELKNETLSTVYFDVRYGIDDWICSDDLNKKLAPEKTLKVKTGLCLVQYVEARVFDKKGMMWIKTSWKGFGRTGGKFTVSGPHKSGLRYRITKK